ncbi:AzlC family ABC transporter permease [Roseateles terrae]|uniref:Branched-subunit amino acid permease n=1 Tax=Roseateles terrae TaxID=431060 RepID=A0ABR6GQX7_9BURK|nr:AzlC family ABC transporter permease [Roseateles terrae]MBB3194522.1 putative branched-subunit amino acid permease [Roseateles terrae]OWQ83468.1 branched-chain amino acid ABC transporter permease [Roseateles terrae]
MADHIPAHWRHPEFRQGARDMLGITLGISAWGLVTGVAMVKSGLSVGMALFMSLVVFAGSSQLASLPLLASGAPLWVLWATSFCVNLRFVIFSTQWRHYLAPLPRGQRLWMAYFAADLNYVAFLKRFPDMKPDPERQVPYFWGGVAINWFAWQVPAIAGIFLADRIPTNWGLGFAGVLALLGLSYSLLGNRNTWVSAAVAACAAVAAYGLPLRLNILVAIAAAVAAGLMMERWAPNTDGQRGRAA